MTSKHIATEIPDGFTPAIHGGPYAAGLGPFYRRYQDGCLTLGIRILEHHCNTHGAAHGGFIASLSDLALIHAVSLAQADAGKPRTYLTTANLSVDYAGRAPKGCWLEVRCDVSRLGGRLGFVEGGIFADGQRVGRTSAIIAVLGPRPE